ncbi:MAG: succinyl-diaminopimelate desuccinylase [Pseudomonadota bacterium]
MSNTSDAFDLTCELIRRPSVTPDDAGCQTMLGERLAAAGFALESMRFNDTDNLWARRGTAGPLLCFAGHTDVVPPGDLAAWSADPYTPTVRDELLYGRGAADMKASLAAMVIAVERFTDAHPDAPGSLALLLTSDEEGPARDGTRRVIETLNARDEHIDWCVVGEPSSHRTLGDTIRIGRRGSLSGMLTVRGIQGHVAYPQLARNPISDFAPLLAELTGRHWDDGNAAFPPTSFQVVRIGADAGAVNVIPGELTARFNFRYSTEWTHETLQAEVEAMFARHDMDADLRWHLSGEPYLTTRETLIDAVESALSQTLGRMPERSTGGGTSDGRFISPAGAEVVEIGPINASIHKIDEHIRIADIDALADVYEGVIKKLLLSGSRVERH